MGETRELQGDAEITLGTGKLLGIFFGLAVICAVFFTMGYMLGRGSAAGAKTETAPPTNLRLATTATTKVQMLPPRTVRRAPPIARPPVPVRILPSMTRILPASLSPATHSLREATPRRRPVHLPPAQLPRRSRMSRLVPISSR
jgi:DedD protein